MAKRAFSLKSFPTWGPTISTRRISTSFPVADLRAFSILTENPWVAMSDLSVRIRYSFSFRSPNCWTDDLFRSIVLSPDFMSSMFAGARNFTCINVPPAKSMPYLGPLWIKSEARLIRIIARDMN